jgi:hypothetical protein
MSRWIRRNADRLVLFVWGIAVFWMGLAQSAQREALAVTLVVLGVVVLVLAVVLPRVESFSVGPKGLEARLGQIERKVETVEGKLDQIVAVGTIESKGEVVSPNVVQHPAPHGSE